MNSKKAKRIRQLVKHIQSKDQSSAPVEWNQTILITKQFMFDGQRKLNPKSGKSLCKYMKKIEMTPLKGLK